jgi:hypothetical protein
VLPGSRKSKPLPTISSETTTFTLLLVRLNSHVTSEFFKLLTSAISMKRYSSVCLVIFFIRSLFTNLNNNGMYSGRAKLVNEVIKSASNRPSEFYRCVFGEKSVTGLTKVESLMPEVLDVLLEELFLESNFSKSAGQVQRSNSFDPVVFAIRKSGVFCLGVDVVFLAKSVDVLSPNSRLVDRVSFSSWHRSSSLNAFHRRLSFFVVSWSAAGNKVDHLSNSLLDSRFFSHFLLVV